MAAFCFVLRRLDTCQYYKGSAYLRSFEKRWTQRLDQAKKYKRKGDASQAVSLMREQEHMVKALVIDRFRLLLDETWVCP